MIIFCLVIFTALKNLLFFSTKYYISDDRKNVIIEHSIYLYCIDLLQIWYETESSLLVLQLMLKNRNFGLKRLGQSV